MQGEFRMITDLAAVAPKELRFNYEEVKQFLTESLQEYRTLVVTADDISDAKAKRAKINKLVDSINSYRINVKKQLMEQYDTDFKPKCDELVAMAKEAGDNIGDQIKAFDEAEAQAKIDAIRAVYDEGDAEAREFCPWERVYNEKWKNKGFGFEDAKDAVLAEFKKTRDDIATIRAMETQDVPALLTEYKRTHDIGAAIRLSNTLRQQREAEAKRRAEEAERKKIAQIEEAQRKNREAAQKSTVEYAPSEEPEIQPTDFRVWADKRQLMALKAFLKANGIKYGRVTG